MIVSNHSKVHKKCACLSRVLGKECAEARTTDSLYMAVVQSFLLFRSETCMASPLIGRTLGGFHHWVIRQLTGQQTIRQVEGSWAYELLVMVMVEAVLKEVDLYVVFLQKTFAKLIATKPIMDIFLAVDQRPRAHVSQK